MHTFVVRSFIAVSAFTSALACSSMVEHREGQTQHTDQPSSIRLKSHKPPLRNSLRSRCLPTANLACLIRRQRANPATILLIPQALQRPRKRLSSKYRVEQRR